MHAHATCFRALGFPADEAAQLVADHRAELSTLMPDVPVGDEVDVAHDAESDEVVS